MSAERPLLDVLVLWSAAGGAWLATYWLHSTILLGTAWLVLRLPFAGRDRAADVVWRLALVGGLVTATARVAMGPAPASALRVEGPRREVRRIEVRTLVRGTAALPPTPEVRAFTASRLRPGAAGWLAALFAVWLVGAGGATVRYARDRRRLRRLLALRRPLDDTAMRLALDELLANGSPLRRVRCWVSDELPTPIAFGSAEICLPRRACVELTGAQQRSVLAHEIAHLVRRDPAWLTALDLLRAVLWLQPLNALALREWSDAAELRCDDWAARATGRRKTLAAALATVATWVPATGRGSPLAALVSMRSPLVRRVERLLATEGIVPSWRVTAAVMIAICCLLTIASAGPAVAFGGGSPVVGPVERDVMIVRRLPVEAPPPIRDLAP